MKVSVPDWDSLECDKCGCYNVSMLCCDECTFDFIRWLMLEFDTGYIPAVDVLKEKYKNWERC